MFHIHKLYEQFGCDKVFGRSAVVEFLGLKNAGASKLLANLLNAKIIEPVFGYGKSKYKRFLQNELCEDWIWICEIKGTF